MNLDDEAAQPTAVADEAENLSFWTLKISESLTINEFRYEPIQQDEIRLVTLLPQSAGYPIFCEISHATLELKPTYEALSYTWESAEMLTTISMNGQPIPIRRNLWLALCHLRDLEKPRILWIDALCIDQKNNDERSSQVSLMHKIYSSASKVLAWLGAEADGSNAAVEDIEILAKRIQGHRSKSPVDEARKADGRAILSLFKRNYWSRVWIIQELKFASSIELHCGLKILSWQALRVIISEKNFWRLPSTWWDDETPESTWSNSAIAFTPASTLVRLRRAGATTLKDLLYLHRKSVCADPRDRIYGLLNIASDCQDGGIKADYSKSACQLYVDVMAWCLDPSRCHASKNRDNLGFSALLHNALQNPFWNNQTKRYFEYSGLDVLYPDLSFPVHGQIRSNTVSLGAPVYLGGTSISISPLRLDNLSLSSNGQRLPDISGTLREAKALIWDLEEQTLRKIIGGDWKCKETSDFCHDTFEQTKACLLLSNQIVGLSSSVVEERDLICEFPNCDVIALVRPDAQNPISHSVVGRVIKLLVGQYREVGGGFTDYFTLPLSSYSQKLRDYESDLVDIRLQLNVETACFLTR